MVFKGTLPSRIFHHFSPSLLVYAHIDANITLIVSQVDQVVVYTPVLTTPNMAQNQEHGLSHKDSEKVINAVVTITHCYTQAFDEFGADYGEATGFVVDKTKG